MSEEQTVDMVLQIGLDSDDPDELDRVTRQLRDEIRELGVQFVKSSRKEQAPQGTKSVDPIVLGALTVAIGPAVLTKFLEFLHAWAMRREGHVVKLKLQTKDGATLEVEVPATMSPVEVKDWISKLRQSITNTKEKKQG